jgi:hexosaminidase
MKRIYLLSSLLIFVLNAFAQSTLPIIPQPVSVEQHRGSYKLEKTIGIFSIDSEVAGYLQAYLIEQGYKTTTATLRKANVVVTLFKPDTLLPEGYHVLTINKNGVGIHAVSGTGLFYGVQTLIQLMALSEKNTLPYVSITDYPRFTWRGLHLDVCRHFFPVSFIKKYIDVMAHYKLNKFHWHLTEDQGWRIEIKKYPKLQEVAAYRKETLIGHYSNQPHQFDGKKYGGYYTQEEIREVVEYAGQRHITVVPEIEMPGHSLAALSAYPHLGCTGGPYEAATKWGVFNDVYCAGKESTFTFLQDVLDEVMSLFPSEYIHVGGDECPKERWKKCEHCQKRMRNEKLKDEHELQSYFIQRIEKYLNSKGRKLIGWDEILEGGLAPNATVMSWRGESGGIAAAKSGHNVVMSPGFALYFDHYQARTENEPVAIGGFTPLRKVYEYDPTPPSLNSEEAQHILGAQANVWTEYIPTTEHVEYMVYPRALALAEVVWSPRETRNWDNFYERVNKHLSLLASWKVNYRKPLIGDQVPVSFLRVTVKSKSGTVDGHTVTLFRSLKDLQSKTNAVATSITGKNGQAQFRYLEPINYFILVSKENNNTFSNPLETGSLKSWDTTYKEINIDY